MTEEERNNLDLRQLALLDPARAPRPDAGRGPAAQALLADILETPQSGSSASGPDRVASRSGRLRWVAVAAAAAAVAVGLVVVSPWSAPEQAFATWTAVPREVAAESVDELGEQCTTRAAREELDQEAVIAEERGRVTFVVTATPYSLGHCLLVDGEMHTSGSAGPRLRGQQPEVAPTEVETYMAAGGGTGEDAYTAIIGRTGQDVVGVEVHPLGPITEPGALAPGELPESVTATVENGYYGAWWPGISEDFELTIHLADGSVIVNVPAFDHNG